MRNVTQARYDAVMRTFHAPFSTSAALTDSETASADGLNPAGLRQEIACLAARWIVEDGLDYASAKQKAAKSLLGKTRVAGHLLPDNTVVESEVQTYLAIFQGESQPQLLQVLREIAAHLMRALAPYRPYLCGAILQGSATTHSDLHLQCFCDSPKDVAIALLNAGIDYEVSESAHFLPAKQAEGIETLSFFWRGTWPEGRTSRQLFQRLQALRNEPLGIHLALFEADDERGAGRLPGKTQGKTQRAHLAGVESLLAAHSAAENDSPA